MQQIEYDGCWYDSRVTVVDGDEIEYTDWDRLSEDIPRTKAQTECNDEENEEDAYGFFFSEEQLRELGKGTRRHWRPWRKNTSRCDIRPYRCFHVSDTAEAPVVYPDFRFKYYDMSDS